MTPPAPPLSLESQAEASQALYQSLVEDAFEFVVTVDAGLTVHYANRSLFTLLGWTPHDVVGNSIVDFVHPDDLERAASALAGWPQWGTPAGASSFRLRHVDGSWLTFDITASTVTDGLEQYVAVYARPADYQHATEAVLTRLMTGASRAESLAPVVDVFEWRLNRAQIAVAWYEEDLGHQFVSTGLPRALTGAEDDPGSPWAEARATGRPVQHAHPGVLDPRRCQLAVDTDRGGLWVEPVPDITSGVPALVTVWTRAGGPSPAGHAYGMAMARVYVELILRWTHQVAQLSTAAHTDPLTGLPNRRALYHLLDHPTGGGAVLFCDLDRFKPVNDVLGHHTGDEVLRQVGARLTGALRGDDLVARVGGDEFVVVARGATGAQADELAHRLTAAMVAPFQVADRSVSVGLTIGVAHSPVRLDQQTLADADRAMLRVKVGRHQA